jgi:hypothetical protein
MEDDVAKAYEACDSASACYRSVPILLTSVLILLPVLFCADSFAGDTTGNASAQKEAPKQHFACNVGYTQRECELAMTVLRSALTRYPVDALGEWTWVLVRAEDWKQILSDRKFDSNHPAFSYLPKRETFFDGTLLVRSSIRGAELSATWHMPIQDLLDLAVRHELAHALCNEHDELKANQAAMELRNRAPLSCRTTLSASKQQ